MVFAGKSEGDPKTASSYLGLTLGDGGGRERAQVHTFHVKTLPSDLRHTGCFSPSTAVSEWLTTILDGGVLVYIS